MGHRILDDILQERLVPSRLTRGSLTAKKWSTTMSWSKYFDVWIWVIGVNWSIGAVTLLAVMAFPLSAGFLAYHLYLIWSGMTTNESSKWADWREDIRDGLAYRASVKALRGDDLEQKLPEDSDKSSWPTRSSWWVILTRNGEQPTRREMTPSDGQELWSIPTEIPDLRWEKVQDVSQLQNIYDLGLLNNLRDVFNRS